MKIKTYSLFLVLCISSLCASSKVIEDKAQIPLLSPVFSERRTEKIELENGLKAYIISDPTIDKSSAALTIKVGSWSDPKEYPGIAHFLEHMLFLGTKKYPKESEYIQFINEHGGQFNAFTANDFTGYVFSIDNSDFSNALDRFSHFFKDPLFNPSGVDRELQAINQEYAKNIENDDIRQYYILKEIVNPGHPNDAFSMGNRETLQKVSQESLKEWYHSNYSANRMVVEVISNLPLDKLKQLVIDDFSGVPNLNIPPAIPSIPSLSEAAKGHMIYIEPVKNIRKLVLAWELPFKFASMRDTKPELLICHVLGHEGKNSLVAELKKEKLIEGLQCGADKLGGNSYILFLQIDLTDAGLSDINEVILRCFEAIANFKKKGIPPYLIDELKTMTKLNYQYQSREDAFEHIIHEAMQLPNEDLSTYPEQSQTFQKYDAHATMELIDYLTPENSLIEVIAPAKLTGVPMESKEKWLDVPYTLKAIPQDLLVTWKNAQPNSKIDLPELNPYLPAIVTLFSEKDSTKPYVLPIPQLLLDNDNGKIYFAQDSYYAVPTISWVFEIKTPTIDPIDVDSQVLGDLFVKLVNETLNTYTYPASVAGLNFGVQRTSNGLAISIDGYNDKSQTLFVDLLKAIKNLKPSEQKFNTHKELLLRDFQNDSLEMPIMQAFDKLKSILYKNYFSSEAKADAIEKVTFQQFQQFTEALFQKTYIEGIMYGNIKENQAQEVTSSLLSVLNNSPYPKNEQPKEEVAVFPKDKGPFFVEEQSKVQGNAVILTIAMDPFSFKERAEQQILMQAIKEPFFSTLRTKQQTGYIVASKADEIEQHLFDTFAVQSNTHEGRDLLARFELFIEGFLQELGKTEITKERFENIKRALLTTIKQPPQNLSELTALLYKLAFSYEGDFDRINKRIKAFDDLTYEQFIESTRQTLGKENKRRIAIIFTGSTPEDNMRYQKFSDSNQLRELINYEPAIK